MFRTLLVDCRNQSATASGIRSIDLSPIQTRFRALERISETSDVGHLDLLFRGDGLDWGDSLRVISFDPEVASAAIVIDTLNIWILVNTQGQSQYKKEHRESKEQKGPNEYVIETQSLHWRSTLSSSPGQERHLSR